MRGEFIEPPLGMPNPYSGLVMRENVIECRTMKAQELLLYDNKNNQDRYCLFADGSLISRYILRKNLKKLFHNEYKRKKCIRWMMLNGLLNLMVREPFGELHNKVSLGCLKYIGSIQTDNKEKVLIKDERGQVYTLGVGEYMGEYSGVIVKIDDDTIYLEKNIYHDGVSWSKVTMKFLKN